MSGRRQTLLAAAGSGQIQSHQSIRRGEARIGPSPQEGFDILYPAIFRGPVQGGVAIGNDGIRVGENSVARIGFLFGSDTVARPNTIQTNGDDGIEVKPKLGFPLSRFACGIS